MNNFENNKENQWNNIEKKNSNWFREKRESIKNFLEWKKNVDKLKVEEETSRKAENLKDSAIDSTLDIFQLDMQEKLEVQDSQTEIKKELNDTFYEWKWKKDSKETIKEKDLYQHLLEDDRFKDRSPEAVQQIARSATNVENEIKQWKWIFYGIVRKIMTTEK